MRLRFLMKLYRTRSPWKPLDSTPHVHVSHTGDVNLKLDTAVFQRHAIGLRKDVDMVTQLSQHFDNFGRWVGRSGVDVGRRLVCVPCFGYFLYVKKRSKFDPNEMLIQRFRVCRDCQKKNCNFFRKKWGNFFEKFTPHFGKFTKKCKNYIFLTISDCMSA